MPAKFYFNESVDEISNLSSILINDDVPVQSIPEPVIDYVEDESAYDEDDRIDPIIQIINQRNQDDYEYIHDHLNEIKSTKGLISIKEFDNDEYRHWFNFYFYMPHNYSIMMRKDTIEFMFKDFEVEEVLESFNLKTPRTLFDFIMNVYNIFGIDKVKSLNDEYQVDLKLIEHDMIHHLRISPDRRDLYDYFCAM